MFKDWACVSWRQWMNIKTQKWTKWRIITSVPLLHLVLSWVASCPDPPALYCCAVPRSRKPRGAGVRQWTQLCPPGTAVVSPITCSAGLSVIDCQAMWLSTCPAIMSVRFWRVCSSWVCQCTEVWEPRAWVCLWTLTVADVCPCQLGGPEPSASHQLAQPKPSPHVHADQTGVFSKRGHDWSSCPSWNKCSVHKYAYRLWISLPPLHISSAFVSIFFLSVATASASSSLDFTHV